MMFVLSVFILFMLPIFPFSLVTNRLISSLHTKNFVMIMLLLFMFANLLLNFYKINIAFTEPFYLFTLVLYSFRILSVNNLKSYILYLYPIISSMTLVLYIERGFLYEYFIVLAILFFVLLSLFLILSKKFNVIHKKSLVGLGGTMPRFSLLFILSILSISLVFVLMGYETINIENLRYQAIFLLVILLSWMFLNWANIRLFEWLIFGKAKPSKIYTDLNDKQMMSLSILILISMVIFLYYGTGVGR